MNVGSRLSLARLLSELALVAFVLLGAAATRAEQTRDKADGQTCELRPSSTHAVARVIDSETLALEDGRELRLVGALAPRAPLSAAGAAWLPESEAVRALQRLVEGRSIEIATGGSRSRDRYGRLMGQAFVSEGSGRQWVQGALLLAGHARAYSLPGNGVCLSAMIAAERSARENARGLWSNAAYRVRQASDVSELLGLASEFVIVEGRVFDVTKRGKRLYLNFGPDWRRDFTIAVPAEILRDAAAAKLEEARGKSVRVRGWLERRNGPLIEITAAADLEVLDGGPAGP